MTDLIEVFAETEEEVDLLCQKIEYSVDFDKQSTVFDQIETINGIDVYYNEDLYVGSNQLGYDIAHIIQHYYPNKKFKHTLDWCCGAGFLGFTIFSSNLTEELTLMDKYSPAITACDKTIQGIAECDKIHATTELPDKQFDLVIGNPPWFLINNMLLLQDSHARKTSDIDGKIHKEFLHDIKSRLTSDGVIILVEGKASSSPLCFKDMIEENDLKITKVLGIKGQPTYFMMIENSK